MKYHCEHCGAKLETDGELERGICDDCLHEGFYKLKEVIGKMARKRR